MPSNVGGKKQPEVHNANKNHLKMIKVAFVCAIQGHK
jgi:hypothetical protein